MKLDAVPVPVVEDSDAVFHILGSAGLPEEEVVRLSPAVVTGRAEETFAADDGRRVDVDRGPQDVVRNPEKKTLQ